ncbi:methyl-accepting chemotaxis protein [Natranaerovirga hydrolytica]|uniref:Methyl-accepting chemotaxis protein n=1 Tax=Natranaerovirga hydrolytica TaxID=680378 RepID=A0A4R1MR84_9FIRM|nr:extracellular solute-binding protein [Natranaerovirga hydrolytica]TCK92403.1 methyl-accepting chemotaxis protein [Natranaerovirga hydrolytica]
MKKISKLKKRLGNAFAWLFKMSVYGQIVLFSITVGFILTISLMIMVEDKTSELMPLIVGLWLGLLFYNIMIKIILNNGFYKSLRHLEKTTNAMAKGDLSKRFSGQDFSKEAKQIAKEVNHSIEGLKNIISNINEQADSLYDASEHLKENSGKNSQSFKKVVYSMKELSNGTTEQAQYLTEAAENINTLSTLIHQVTEETNDIAQDSHKVSGAAQKGQDISHKVNDQITQIYDSTKNISNVIEQLNKTSEEIKGVTTVIRDIGEQTNLLALNAAIEAARAGEHGRGFSVVAEETRKLAQQSMDATQMIENLLEEMNHRNNGIVDAIQKGVLQAEEGKEFSNNATKTFEDIFEILNNNISKIEDVANFTKEITTNSASVNEKINNIAAFSEEITASTQEVLAISQEQTEYNDEILDLSTNLNKTATNLKKSITIYLSMSFFGKKDRVDITQKAINTYIEKNPYLQFNIENVEKDSKIFYPRLIKGLEEGQCADIIQINQPWLKELKSMGNYFVDLYKDSNIDLDGFDQNALKMCTVDGVLMGLPTGLNALSFHMNKNFFQEYNIDIPNQWTWNDLLTIGKAIQNKNKNKYLLVASTKEFVSLLMKMYLKQKTGKPFVNEDYTLGFDYEDILEMYHYFKTLIHNNILLTDLRQLRKNEGNYNDIDENDNFGEDVAMVCRWVSDYEKTLKDIFKDKEVSIAMPPIDTNAKSTGLLMKPQLMIGINNHSDNIKEAVKFINWIYNEPEGIKAWGTNRGPSPTIIGKKVQKDEKMVNPNILNALEEAVEKGGQPENQLSSHIRVVNYFTKINDKIIEGSIDEEKGAQLLIKGLDKIIRKIKKTT